ncbi:MAG: hypothetical protein KatS3mg110_1994 [Pirellulaceae bacterium]|nr:MAG: hypothetical protein KatS3mg110_1994 [Pirellulaceae bacterium]
MNAFCVCMALVLAGQVELSWVSFRNGGTSTVMGQNLPLKWSPSEGIAWQVELPGYGQSSPVTWGNRLYVTSVEGPHKETSVLLALDAKSGEVVWRVAIPSSSTAPSNYFVARAAPTPCVDSKAVYAFFEGGDVVAVAHDGQVLWKRSLVADFGPFLNHHGLGASPAQTHDSLVLNIQHDGPSYLISLDKPTGQTRWRKARKSCKSWSSPIVISQGDRTLVIVSSGGSVQAYDAQTGDELWTLGEISGNAIPSPTYDGEMLFIGAALSDFETETHAARSNVCVKANRNGGVDILWRAERALCDYASPVVADGCVYYVNRIGVLYCLDRATGTEHYAERLPGPCWATPIVAGDRIYFFGKDGVTTVIRSGPQWMKLATNRLWDPANPPQPETYVETPANQPARDSFAQRLLRSDANQDGKLSADELSPESRRMLAEGDKNGDGLLDSEEIQALEEQFRKRRENARHESRDPIVYGVAATPSAFYIRTGTRLYCVTNSVIE